MMRGTELALAAYQVCVLALYGLAVVDVAGGRLRMRRWSRRLALAWISVQVTMLVTFAAIGGLGRAMHPLLFYGSGALMLFALLPAGAHWTIARNGRGIYCSRYSDAGAHGRELLRACSWAIVVSAFCLAVTVLLTRSFSWSPARELASALAPQDHTLFENALFAAYLLVSAAVMEEILFRHYLLNFIAARTHSQVLAAIVTTALFILGHAGALDPFWLKSVQILLLGSALAVVQIRIGIEGAITTHLLFNAGAAILGSAGWL